MQGLAKQSIHIMTQGNSSVNAQADFGIPTVKQQPFKPFNDFLFDRLYSLSHINSAYATEDEAIQHFMSGEVTVPFTDVLRYVREWNDQYAGIAISDSDTRLLVMFGNYLFERYNVQVFSNDGKNQPIYQRQVADADICNFCHDNAIERLGREIQKLPSRFQNGDKVQINYGNSGVIRNCEVIKVHFSESKVLYDVSVGFSYGLQNSETGGQTRLYNVDSAFVEPAELS